MFCPYCGTKNDESNRFCLKCGCLLVKIIEDGLQPSALEKAPHNLLLPIILSLAIVLFIIGLALITKSFAGGQSPIDLLGSLFVQPTPALVHPTPTFTVARLTPTAQNTPTSTGTPIPTTSPTDTPTASATLKPTPAINTHFRVDDTTICSGRCTTLLWDVDHVRAVYLDGQGQVGHGSKVICPSQTQSYALRVILNDRREVLDTITVSVSGQCPGRTFAVDYKGCIGHEMRLGSVKGQVFDNNGRVIPGARVEIWLDGARWDSPANPATVNSAGWYEWVLTPGQRVRFVSLTMGNTRVTMLPANFEVTSRSGCFQHVNFREQ